jgi:hypothetical protein
MNLEKCAHIAEIVSGTAIVVTLVILIAQVRDNTEAVRSQTAQATFALSFEGNTFLSGEEGRAYEKFTREGREAVSDEEYSVASRAVRAVLTSYDNYYYQYRHGNLDNEVFLAYERRLQANLSRPGFLSWWLDNQNFYTASFQAYVQSLLDSPSDGR